jgi:hypothetical protein
MGKNCAKLELRRGLMDIEIKMFAQDRVLIISSFSSANLVFIQIISLKLCDFYKSLPQN